MATYRVTKVMEMTDNKFCCLFFFFFLPFLHWCVLKLPGGTSKIITSSSDFSFIMPPAVSFSSSSPDLSVFCALCNRCSNSRLFTLQSTSRLDYSCLTIIRFLLQNLNCSIAARKNCVVFLHNGDFA